ncbi:muconate cycloisomerase [Halopolyspora algeriensis]|uniref:Muconate cycloisomerase n=1 Tax=Halopolyspora algeriensis TaxID=1500506 RepID=A0A368VWK9_9ACTN|nr:muconate cycloisomerase family protein [Halopolyspora algeriensis]RCW45750.1 muconate cycloisomerase [Halopolyspora algeriensis]TQM54134.1 muconate cycloisomerase [Halopolyspora algeriensis]
MSSLTIQSVDTVIVDLPTRRPHKFKSVTMDYQSYVIARVRTADGIEGIGESTTPGGPWWGGESVETIKATIDTYLAPELIGQQASRIDLLLERMDRIAADNQFAKACVEMALFDAWGKALGVPVHDLLGGLFRESIPVTWALSADDADIVIGEAEEKLTAEGHRSFKLKAGAQRPEEDVSRILSVAKALGDRASVRVDFNAAWDANTAARWLPKLESGGIDLIEQPIPGWNIEAMGRLAAQLTIPIMADESVRSVQDAYTVCRYAAGDIFSLKVNKLGGLSRTKKTAAVAESMGIPCHGGTSIESSIGTAAAAHVYGALPNVTFGSELFGPKLLADDLTEESLVYDKGELQVPDGPGLGVRLDEVKLAEYRRS